MPKLASKRSDRTFRSAQPRDKTYLIADGDGLSLRVQPSGSKTWLFRYRKPSTGKETFIGLGPYPTISLSEARTQANNFRNRVLNGTDPGEERRAEAQQQRLGSFEAVANAWLEFKRAGWATETTRKAELVLRDYLIPKLQGKPISTLSTPEVVAALTFTAANSPNLAEKARQYISGIVRLHGVALLQPLQLPRR